MMLKKILTLHTPKGTSLRTTASKVISRTLTEQGISVEGKWDLLSAVCLERHPVITKPMKDIEERYQKMLQQIEYENSLLSDFEIKKQKEESKKNKASKETENVTSIQTIQDLEDSWEEEVKKFKFACRISENKEDNEVVSLKRKLDKNLVLLVEQKVGNSSFFLPPQSIRRYEETMIQTASRTLQDLCGDNLRVQFYGNAPIGFYRYKYPKNIQDKDKDGAKIFYFLAKYVSGHIPPNVKHCWLDREELQTTVHPKIHKSLSQFLLPD